MHKFDRDLALTETAPGRYLARITGDWSINNVPNGGFVNALAAGALLKKTDKRDSPVITASFINRLAPGDAELTVTPVSESNQFTRLALDIHQEGALRSRFTGTFRRAGTDGLVRYEAEPPPVPDPEACVVMPFIPKYTLYNQVDVRLDPSCVGWLEGRVVDKSEHTGWFRFPDGRAHDQASVLLALDAFPPPIMASQGMTAWAPTIEMMVSIRNIPAGQWLKCRFRTRFIDNGVLEEDGEVWGQDGRLAAISRQIALYRK